jgi:hypothetical protein
MQSALHEFHSTASMAVAAGVWHLTSTNSE